MRATGRKCTLRVTALVALAAAAFLVTTVGARPETVPQRGKAPAARELTLPAAVVAYEEVRLFSRLSGFVQKVQADIGDRVKKGQVLAVIAVPEVEAKLMQKKALVVQAEAEVQRAQLLVREASAALSNLSAQVEAAEAGGKAARAQLEYRRKQFERYKELGKAGTVDQRIVEEAGDRVKAAEAALAEAEAKLRTTKAARDQGTAQRGTAEVGVKVAQARREVAKADLERVAALLQYARIVAPFDGVVTQRTVSPGDLAAPPRGRDAPLFTVARVDMVRVVVAVPDAHAARVRVGVDAAVRLDALPGQVFKGKVSRLAGALDPTKRTLRVEIDLPNRDGKLLPGVHGHVVLMLGQN